jgi:maltose O-acetyltransferase
MPTKRKKMLAGDDYNARDGENVYIGNHTFINMNCVLLDSAEIRIGEDGLIGPSVQLYTVSHPLRAADRIVAGWTPAMGRSRYRTEAAPIQIGSRSGLGAERSSCLA